MKKMQKCLLLFGTFFILILAQPAFSQPACPSTSANCTKKWAGGEKNLSGHYEKHKSENSTWRTPTNYTNAAVNTMNYGQSHIIQNGRNAGRVMYYCNDGAHASNVFVVTNNRSEIISCFRPTSGQRYYDRQVQADQSNSGPPAPSSRSVDENDSDAWTIYTTYQCNPHTEP